MIFDLQDAVIQPLASVLFPMEGRGPSSNVEFQPRRCAVEFQSPFLFCGSDRLASGSELESHHSFTIRHGCPVVGLILDVPLESNGSLVSLLRLSDPKSARAVMKVKINK